MHYLHRLKANLSTNCSVALNSYCRVGVRKRGRLGGIGFLACCQKEPATTNRFAKASYRLAGFRFNTRNEIRRIFLLQKTGFVPKGITESVFLEDLIYGAEARSSIPENSAIEKLHQGLQLLSKVKIGAFGKVEDIELNINRILNGLDHEGAKMRPDIQSIQKINISAEKLSLLAFRLLESTFTEERQK